MSIMVGHASDIYEFCDHELDGSCCARLVGTWQERLAETPVNHSSYYYYY